MVSVNIFLLSCTSLTKLDINASAGNLLGGFMDNEAAEDRQNSAQAFSAQQYATRYQTTVKDMQAAGLNPMLAYQGIGGSFPTGQTSSPGGSYSGLGSRNQQALATSAQIENVKADTENKKAQADLIQAQAANQWASAAQADANVTRIAADVDKIKAETANLPREGERLYQMANYLLQAQQTMAYKGQTELEQQKYLRALVTKLQSETDLLDLDIEAADRLENIGRTSKELAPIIDIIKSISSISRSR